MMTPAVNFSFHTNFQSAEPPDGSNIETNEAVWVFFSIEIIQIWKMFKQLLFFFLLHKLWQTSY